MVAVSHVCFSLKDGLRQGRRVSGRIPAPGYLLCNTGAPGSIWFGLYSFSFGGVLVIGEKDDEMIELHNCDCMSFMRGLPDKAFDLAIVDPPYGGGQHFNFRFGVGDQVYDSRKPDPEYFLEIRRVSKNQIVWGGNYFTDMIPPNRCWISWSKGNPAPNFSDFELAWTSFDEVCKEIRLDSYGFNHADKRNRGESTIHPTQKPVTLYKWLLKNYAKEGDKILDTHLGSGSIAIACHDYKFDLVGCEIDKDYFEAASKRLKNHQSQLSFV